MEKDNTVAIGSRHWQIEKTRFRHTLAGSTVTIHQHLDETVSMRFGPHVVGRYNRDGRPLIGKERQRRGKGPPRRRRLLPRQRQTKNKATA